ncbi:MAG: flavin reductase family protein [Armatimonadota bacterium]|nr:flavin reductase family protein [Armatimonadota bacterium]
MEPKARKQALDLMTYGLYVVGTHRGEEKHAVMVNWLTQASFDPPLVVLALMKEALSTEMVAETGQFSVNIPAADQAAFAKTFIRRRPREGNRLGGYEFYTKSTGAPIFTDALAFFECRVVATVDRGDHLIFVAEVIDAGVHREGDPLTLRATGMHYAG